jgi:RND family efflux transporter MFP subunit
MRSAAKAPEPFEFTRRLSLVALPLALLLAPVAIAGEKDAAPEFACLIQPKMVLKLGSQVQGLLSEVLVDRGALVKEGEVVARLESGVEQSELAIAKARAANDSTVQSDRAKVEFQTRKAERSKELRKTEAMAISTFEEAETAAKVAEGDLREAEVNQELAQLEVVRSSELLKLRTIRSPINGVVVERTLGPGEYVGSDQTHLLTIAQIDPLYVEVYVPVSQFGRIRVGMPGEVYPEVGGRYVAHVTVVDQVYDAASATIGVRLELPNPDYALPAGLKCQVRFPGIG